MDNNTIRYSKDQYGNDDYAQLDRWSAYKASPNDNTSLIYTSDYGSYSSQESNHSGTTYSNLADCEEVLHSSPLAAYDVPAPHLFGSMERRRDKPLPPPRMTSKPQISSRFLEPVKEKKISFDDSVMTNKNLAGKTPSSYDNVPSFATLPRKKKLVSGSTTTPTPTQPAAQVTWMKDVAQKAEFIHQPNTSDSGSNTKKPHGILKNKGEELKKKGDTTGYIQRNTVQRILDQQRKALNRQSTSAVPQFYKSMPILRPAASADAAQASKAWEHNYKDTQSCESSTAQVIGVLEPSAEPTVEQIHHHLKQNSNETEFEFPPPPTDYDLAQIMDVADSPKVAASSSTAKSDFTPLKLACNKQTLSGAQDNSNSIQSHSSNATEAKPRPPIPQRLSKPVANSSPRQSGDCGFQFKQTTPQSGQNSPPKVIAPPRRATVHSKQEPVARPRKPQSNNLTVGPTYNSPPERLPSSGSAEDIVLPPPLQFQEASPLATQQPSYGDYEVLSPEAQYQCSHHPLTSNTTNPNPYSQYNYHQKIAIDQLKTNIAANLKLDENRNSQIKTPTANHRDYSYSPRDTPIANGYMSQPAVQYHDPNYKSNRVTNHHHQYSTEL